jgi:hypothetical protein
MRVTSRQIRALLLALTIGVWGLLARSLFPPTTGEASPAPAARRVYVVSSSENGKIFFDNSPGNIDFNASGLVSVLEEAARRGVKIHSVVSPSGLGGYVVFVEK